MNTPTPPLLEWVTSSYSGNGGGNCVEVARTTPAVFIQDTKARSNGRLSTSPAAWAAFLGFAKSQDI